MDKKRIHISDSIFNFKLYIQGLKQLKMVGLASLICATIYAILFSVTTMTNMQSDGYSELLKINEVYTPLYIVLYLIVPLMCIILFNFLTKRNGSDFYHSIPQKRQCVFTSFLAAIISWALILIFGFTALFSILLKLLTPELILSVPNVLVFCLNIFISCILVAAVFALGCSLSGTIFSNIVTSLLILVVPRLLISIFCYIVMHETRLVHFDSMFILTRDYCNMVTYPIMPFILETDIYRNIAPVPFMQLNFSTVYTFVIAIIYIFAGCKIYTKRSSEAAGTAYHNKWLKITSRMLIGYIISLFIVYLIFDDSYIFITSYIIIFVFAAIVMFIYEVIFTKSLKKGLKTFISSPLILVFDVITFGILSLACYRIEHHIPDAEDVDYIYIDEITLYENPYSYDEPSIYMGESPLNPSINYYIDNEYYNYRMSNIKITNRQIIEDVISSLESEITGWMGYRIGDKSVTIDDGLFDITRDIKDISAKLMTIPETREEIAKVMTDIPDLSDNIAINCSSLTPYYTSLLYETFVYEFNQMSVDEQFELIFSNPDDPNISCIDVFNIDKYVDGHYMSFMLPITRKTPETFTQYLKYYNICNEKSLLKILDTVNPEQQDGITLYIAELTGTDDIELVESYAPWWGLRFDSFEKAINLTDMLTDFAINGQSSYEIFDHIDQDKYYLCRLEINDYYIVADEHYSEYYFLVDKESDIFEKMNKLYEDKYFN